MRVTAKGQVTIPRHIREQAGLLPMTEVEFSIQDGVVILRPVVAGRPRGAVWTRSSHACAPRPM